MREGIARRPAGIHGPSGATTRDEDLAVEEPLEIRVNGRSLTVVMRTPGDDEDLIRGLLLSEGVVGASSEMGEGSPGRRAGEQGGQGRTVEPSLGRGSAAQVSPSDGDSSTVGRNSPTSKGFQSA